MAENTCATCNDPCPNEQCIKCWEREVLGVGAHIKPLILTNEELAETERRDCLFGEGRIVGEAAADRRILLAALQASREETALFSAETKRLRSEANTLRVRNGELRAEVERLLGFLADIDRKQYEAEVVADWRAQQ